MLCYIPVFPYFPAVRQYLERVGQCYRNMFTKDTNVRRNSNKILKDFYVFFMGLMKHRISFASIRPTLRLRVSYRAEYRAVTFPDTNGVHHKLDNICPIKIARTIKIRNIVTQRRTVSKSL